MHLSDKKTKSNGILFAEYTQKKNLAMYVTRDSIIIIKYHITVAQRILYGGGWGG